MNITEIIKKIDEGFDQFHISDDINELTNDLQFLYQAVEEYPEHTQMLEDYANGLFSNFPKCCVSSFSIDRMCGIHTRHEYPQLWQEMEEHEREHGGVYYVPCKTCLENKTFKYPHELRNGLIVKWNGGNKIDVGFYDIGEREV